MEARNSVSHTSDLIVYLVGGHATLHLTCFVHMHLMEGIPHELSSHLSSWWSYHGASCLMRLHLMEGSNSVFLKSYLDIYLIGGSIKVHSTYLMHL